MNNFIKDEESLIRLSQEGNEEAFTELMQGTRRKIYAICKQIIGDQELAEDCTQETYIKAFKNIQSFRKESRFSSWLYRIAVNVCINAIRKQKSLHESASPVFEKAIKYEPIEDMVIHQALEEGMQALSSKHRKVFEMYELEGLTHNEIAKRLKIPSATVRSRLHYARKKMKDWLNKY